MPDERQELVDLRRIIEELSQRVIQLESRESDAALDQTLDNTVSRILADIQIVEDDTEPELSFGVPVRNIEFGGGVAASRDIDDTYSFSVPVPDQICDRLLARPSGGKNLFVSGGDWTRNGEVTTVADSTVSFLSNVTEFAYLQITKGDDSRNDSLLPDTLTVITSANKITTDDEGRFYPLAKVTTNATDIIDFELLHCGGDIDDHWRITDSDSDGDADTLIKTLQKRTQDDEHKDEDQIFEADKVLLNSSYSDTLSAITNAAYVAVLDSGAKKIVWIKGERGFEGISSSGQLKVIVDVNFDTSSGNLTQQVRFIRIRAGVVVSVSDETTKLITGTAPCAPPS